MKFSEYFLCPECNSEFHDLDQGTSCCKNCNFKISTKGGVFLLSEQIKTSSNKRLSLAYSEFWKKCKDVFENDEITAEYEILTKYRPYFNGKILADLGSGNGRHLQLWKKLGVEEIICVDLSDGIFECHKKAVNIFGNENVISIHGSIENIPLKEKSVDVCWSAGTLGLIPDQEKTLLNICKHAKSNFFLSVLSEKTFSGKLYLYANYLKPIINKINNFEFLFWLTGVIAHIAYFFIKVLNSIKLAKYLLPKDTVSYIIKNKSKAIKRLQYTLFDPIIIPKIVKHPDSFYIQIAKEQDLELNEHFTYAISDYFFFTRNPENKSATH